MAAKPFIGARVLKKTVVALLGVLLGSSALLAASICFGILPGKTVPVLMYHHVTAGPADEALETSAAVFARQMDFLHRRGYSVMGPEELLLRIKSGAKPRKEVVLTFDDGHSDCYENALPVLEKYGFKAIFFVIGDWVGKPGFMTWDQLKDLQRRGHVVGSHSMSHGFLTAIPIAEAKQEVYNSKHLIEEMLHSDVAWFCYPAGRFNPRIERLVQEAGYSGAFASAPGRAFSNTDAYAIKRIRVRETSDRDYKFWWRVSGYYLLFRERTARRMTG